jgi:hypothetical protein
MDTSPGHSVETAGTSKRERLIWVTSAFCRSTTSGKKREALTLEYLKSKKGARRKTESDLALKKLAEEDKNKDGYRPSHTRRWKPQRFYTVITSASSNGSKIKKQCRVRRSACTAAKHTGARKRKIADRSVPCAGKHNLRISSGGCNRLQEKTDALCARLAFWNATLSKYDV